jgi:serine/threonine protein kinase
MSSASYLDWVRGNAGAPSSARLADSVLKTHSPASPIVDTLPPGLADHPDYEFKKELGRGGMGVVYLAYNRLLDRDEVLKVMGRHLMDRPGVQDRFHREIRAVARLRHPNIVSAYSAFRLEESLVLAMEFVPGLDLSKMVKATGRLPIAHAAAFVYQTALGLEHAHEQGLVHRDVKPGNLMLSRLEGKATIKILDFGLARATREDALDATLTAEGQVLGTLDYIAPEQITDAKRADIRSDIYSLGATFYYLLSGRPPFSASSFYEMCQAHISRTPQAINLVRPEVPAELAAIVNHLMDKDPSRRPQTPKEVAEALTPFFKRGIANDHRPGAKQPSVNAPFDLTHQAEDAPRAPLAPQQRSETRPADSRFDGLVNVSDDGARDSTPATLALAGGHWRPIVAALVATGLLALGVAALMMAPHTPSARSLEKTTIKAQPAKDRVETVDVDDAKEEGADLASMGDMLPAPSEKPAAEPPPAMSQSPESNRLATAPEQGATSQSPPERMPDNIRPRAADNLTTAPGRLVYRVDFKDIASGWGNGDSHGYADGIYFVASGKPFRNWRAHRHLRADGVVEVVGRVRSPEAVTQGSWGVTISKTVSDESRRGFVVKINGKGELSIVPHPSKEAEAFRAVDPNIGPIVHPAIKPGDQPNTLALVLRKRTLDLVVNKVHIYGPVQLEFDPAPSFLLLGAFDETKKFRAEFSSFEIREFSDGAELSTTPFKAIARATRPFYFDDFIDPKSGWEKTSRAGYSAGLYYLAPHDERNTKKCPVSLRTDSAIEIVGRLKTPSPLQHGSWTVIANTEFGTSKRGFMVKINGKGELFLSPTATGSAKEFAATDPKIGPIVHPAIKPANQVNRLVLLMRKRHLEIFVNSEPVYEPVAFQFDLTPASLQLAAWDGPGDFRAEFDSISIREFARP